jgi:hypothetical protein
MLEHNVHMNGHWMIPYQVGFFFYVNQKSKMAATAGLSF